MVPPPATYAGARASIAPLVSPRPAPAEQPAGLLHICREHPTRADGECGPGCEAFCGARWARDGKAIPTRAATPDTCVVCWDLCHTDGSQPL